MYFEVAKKTLLPPLKAANSVVESRQTLAILSHILIKIQENNLYLTATDAEIELTYTLPLEADLVAHQAGETTLPARKLYDIVRTLPETQQIQVNVSEQRATLKAGKSRFSLSCLPAADFPSRIDLEAQVTVSMAQQQLKQLLLHTSFAMATGDVRYYLNGLLLELNKNQMTAVATDGHRLALMSTSFEFHASEPIRVIIPRKAVIELIRLLEHSDNEVTLAFSPTHIKVTISPQLTLISQLIEGQFPDYHTVLPKDPDKQVIAQTQMLKTTLAQSAILSNEKFRGVRLILLPNTLQVCSRNPLQEEAEIECAVDYTGEQFEIGFNVNYLLDVLNNISTQEVQLSLSDSYSSCLLQPKDINNIKYVIMPMRL